MSGPGPASCDYVENVCWSVEERAWKQDLPHLSDDVIALLATPVIVTASAWVESGPPPRDPASNVRVLAPAPPLHNRRRTVSRYVPRAATRTA
jgi:hypothetical protein